MRKTLWSVLVIVISIIIDRGDGMKTFPHVTFTDHKQDLQKEDASCWLYKELVDRFFEMLAVWFW